MRTQIQLDDMGKVSRSKVARRGKCGCPKAAYSSRKIAAARAAQARRERGELILPYRCPHGGHCWHIGHPPGSRSGAPHAGVA